MSFFGLSDATRPADLEPRLRERGAVLAERLAVVALDLGDGVPDLAVPDDVEVRRVDHAGRPPRHRPHRCAVFGGTPADEESLEVSAARLQDESRTSRCRNGTPVGAAGHVVGG